MPFEIQGRSKGGWRLAALEARATSVGPRPTGRADTIEDVCRRHKLSGRTLERAVSALDFCDTHRAQVNFDLSLMPLAAVEVVRRWARYAPEAAFADAAKIVDGVITVRGLIQNEKNARGVHLPLLTDKRLKRNHRVEAIEAYISSEFSEYVSTPWKGKFKPRIDYYLERRDREGVTTTCGVLVQLENGRADQYERMVIELLVRALGLSLLLDEVVVFAPEPYRNFFDQWRAQQNGAAAIQIVSLPNRSAPAEGRKYRVRRSLSRSLTAETRVANGSGSD